MNKKISQWADWLQSYGLEILIKKRYILALYKRLYLIRKDYCIKSEYEKNEIEITELQTRGAITRTISIVSQMQHHYNSELSIYIELLNKETPNNTN